jgi:hypothetical protein
MTSNENAHITLTYELGHDGHIEKTDTFAVSQDTLREAQIRQQEVPPPSGHELCQWLISRGAQYDSQDGPARVTRWTDGTTHEEYYRNGLRHRENAPADIWLYYDGKKSESYYHDDKLHRDNGPAVILRNFPERMLEEQYYINGEPADWSRVKKPASKRPGQPPAALAPQKRLPPCTP